MSYNPDFIIELPCDICGKSVDMCTCPPCPECEEIGNPLCWKKSKHREAALWLGRLNCMFILNRQFRYFSLEFTYGLTQYLNDIEEEAHILEFMDLYAGFI